MSTVTKPGHNNKPAQATPVRARRTASEQLVKQAKQVTDDLQELGGIARETTQEKLGELRDNASEYYEAGRERVHQAERTFEQLIREKPLKSILIAAGIGLVLGRFWMRH